MESTDGPGLRRSVTRAGAWISGIGTVGGFLSDVVMPLGDLAPWLAAASLLAALLVAVAFVPRWRRQGIEAWGTQLASLLLVAAGSSVVFGFWSVALASAPENGFLGERFEIVRQMQTQLLGLEENVVAIRRSTDVIQDTTAAVKADTSALRASVDAIAASFAAIAKDGGLIAAPDTPAEHYHNARLYELKGDFASARRAYNAFLAAGLEVIDPWLRYLVMAKAQDGLEGARESVTYFAQTNATTSYAVARALLRDRDARIAELERLAQQHPEFGPLPYLLSREFSEEKLGQQDIQDKRAEKQWLERFRQLRDQGAFLRYVLDKNDADEWMRDADARYAKLGTLADQVLAVPVSTVLQQSNSGWSATFELTDVHVKEIFYRLDGEGEFRSTGHMPMRDRETGLPRPELFVALPDLAPGAHSLEVKYVDIRDRTNGPFSLPFDTADQIGQQARRILQLTAGSWVEILSGKAYFTHLLAYRGALSEIRYSFDDEALDRRFPLSPATELFSRIDPNDQTFVVVPPQTKFVAVRVTFKDGARSEVRRFSARDPAAG